MGVAPRGSDYRDRLDASRLLDLYAVLGLPIRVSLGCPSHTGADARADADLLVDWQSGTNEWTPAVQADWASRFANLALCKPYVQAVEWAHFTDAEPHQFPHSGVLDDQGQAKPVLTPLKKLRESHLR